mmetsp:Transcript_38626/g.83991  ORF Transcript_38626/g.83991 Transcript_38626/m.83991 type:complete len:395 (-) Transcript_38626:169-1353(-)|eukprot:CAMPEP_0118929158 /NCGR_PEP_ID=MMETSP1169-20130426/6235_1 /TAXON_ID=36882 /ORGANISM="Pyramimonas obovata, Strain CCMP722" /LENGTH=394 /DNA_ID=CAMNT_0006871293 /DNA_START=42 /DNA_END=1226 /DNA_ORIENTATION=+
MSSAENASNGRTDDAFQVVRTCQVPHAFHTMAVEPVPTGLSVYCGCADGKVRLYHIGKNDVRDASNGDLRLKESLLLDTKGGGAVQALWVQRTTNGALEIVAGDSEGLLTIFSQEQIVWRGRFSTAVTAIAAHLDACASLSYIAGDVEGCLLAFSQWERSPEWRLRLQDDFTEEPVCSNQAVLGSGVRGLASGVFERPPGTPGAPGGPGGSGAALVAVCSDRQSVRFYSCGRLASEVALPVSGTCVCCGHFTPEAARRGASEVAVGCATGAIYLVSPWGGVHLLASVGQCVTTVVACKQAAPGDSKDPRVDVLVCAGHFEGVKLLIEGRLVGSVNAGCEWVHDVLSCSRSLGSSSGAGELAKGEQASGEHSGSSLIVLGVEGTKLLLVDNGRAQ